MDLGDDLWNSLVVFLGNIFPDTESIISLRFVLKSLFFVFIGIFVVLWLERFITYLTLARRGREAVRKFSRVKSKITEGQDKEFLNFVEQCIQFGEKIDVHTDRKLNSKKVGVAVYEICKLLELDDETIKKMFCSSLVYDAGFFAVKPDIFRMEILKAKEKAHLKKHVEYFTSFCDLSYEDYRPFMEDVARFHHEKYNGKGYPEKLCGGEIPLGARIIAVAESFVSMTSRRSFHKTYTPEGAVKELLKDSSYDIDIVSCLKTK